MHKVTIALAAFVVFLGCDVGRPTAPSAAKITEASTEQCPMPILDIAGTWVGQSRFEVDCPACDSWGDYIRTADTLRIELAPDPNPTGEPGVTYYDYTLLSYYSPSEWDDPVLADLGLPSLYHERRGKIGVYYADGGKWAYNYTETYIRKWDTETKEYYEPWRQRSPFWGLELKMFDGWLALRWNEDPLLCAKCSYDADYKRVDESTPVEPEFESELTPEIVGLYGTLGSTFTNIFFAALVPGTTSVPGEGGGSVEISGNDWTLNEYSPDGELVANGALNIDLTQDPIPMSGEVTLSGSHEAELVLDMQLSVGADGLSATGTITINGVEFDVAEVSAAAAAEAVINDPGYVNGWVGEYEGTGDFALSNGVSGEDRPVSISIVRVTPKEVTVSATLIYGEGRNDFIQTIGDRICG